ncbi:MAG: TorF family putative porin [Cellvibrio sp.]|uniref:TorF family putative porin n=1 Tax=Cellvibrio sp. TaxID=1965322 RepID=UPI0031A30E57
MKMKQKLVAGAIALSAMAGFSVPAAHAEVSAAVGAANMYYWRGLDLGNGDAQIWGDLKLSGAGFYGGVWAASGDAAMGQEYDLYAGYGNSFGDFKFDISYWTYSYPKPASAVEYIDGLPVDATPEALSPGDLQEAVVMVGYGPVAFTYYDNIDTDYTYMTLAATFGPVTAKYGVHEDDLAHVDITYAYNDKLSFTVGKVVDDVEGAYNDEAKIVVAFTLPIE